MMNLETGIAVKSWNLHTLLVHQRSFIQSKGGEIGYDWGNNVLNGIAYMKERDTFLLTGKNWDLVFEVHLNYRHYIGK